jgi:SAM-dependent methyltransferase
VAGSELDRINQTTWSRTDTLETFAAREGPIDPGEAHVLALLRRELAAGPVLDIGVGGGRTVPLLAPASDDYVAIDYLAEMVSLTRRRFPQARVEHVDARDLSCFADATFAVVFWSANGIDGIGHADRALALAEIRRVLRPGGRFAFSTHNLGSAYSGRPPWDYHWFMADPRIALLRARRLPRRARAYRRARGLVTRGEGWASLVDPAYEFGLVTHFVSLAEARRELGALGFDASVEAFDMRGVPLGPAAAPGQPWFHLIAERS